MQSKATGGFVTLLVEMIRKPDSWERHRFGYVAPIAVPNPRQDLVRGAYVPDSTNTGVLSGSVLTDVEAGGGGYIGLTQSMGEYNSLTDTYDIRNKKFWGQVRFSDPKIRLVNCFVVGPEPDGPLWSTSSNGSGCVKNYGGGYYHGIMESCTIDLLEWVTVRGKTISQANYMPVSGVHGGDIELRWCHIKNVTDGIQITLNDEQTDPGLHGWSDGITVPNNQRFTVIDRCLIERCLYVSGSTYAALPSAQSGGSPHCDAVQFNTGRNIFITGSKLGGTRTASAYQTWETNQNLGTDDFSNAGIMIQQEVSGTVDGSPAWVDNVLIEDNFIGGGNASINVNYKNNNTLDGVTIRDNKIFQRGSDWGVFMQDGSLVSQNGGYGYKVATGSNPSALQHVWTNNTVNETGASVPFTNN